MKILKRILIVLAGLFILLQFYRSPRNQSSTNPSNDISASFNVPADVQGIFRTSCYDCHSDTTHYPWYAKVQPVGWWLNGHIEQGKRQLNFSEYSSYRLRRQYNKFGDIIEQLEGDEMPLPAYLIIHTDAKLSQDQKGKIIAWAQAMRGSMKAKYPQDSLVVKRGPQSPR